jgi:hypothetical protein
MRRDMPGRGFIADFSASLLCRGGGGYKEEEGSVVGKQGGAASLSRRGGPHTHTQTHTHTHTAKKNAHERDCERLKALWRSARPASKGEGERKENNGKRLSLPNLASSRLERSKTLLYPTD